MKNLYGSDEIRRLCIARCVERGTRGGECQGQAGHDGHETRKAPTTDNCGSRSGRSPAFTATEREIVHEALYKRLCAIEVVAGVVSTLVDVEEQAAIVARLETHSFAEGVGSRRGEAAGELAVKFDLQSMVARGVSGEEQVCAGRSPKRCELGKSRIAGASDGASVEIVIHDGIDAVIADVGDVQNELSRERLLNGEVPGLHIGVFEVLIHDKEIGVF